MIDYDIDDEPATLTPLILPYEATCLLCGESRTYNVTERVARAWRAMRFRCPRCRGMVMIDRADVGSVGSTARATMDGYKPVQYRQGVRY